MLQLLQPSLFMRTFAIGNGWPTLSAEQDVKPKKFSNYDKEENEDFRDGIAEAQVVYADS